MAVDEKLVQKRFLRHAIMGFIRSQHLNTRWCSSAVNKKRSNLFNGALLAILDGDFKAARELQRKLYRVSFYWPTLIHRFAWLSYVEADFFCSLLGREMPKPDDRDWPFTYFMMKQKGCKYRRFKKSVTERLPKSRILAKPYADFETFRAAEEKYAHLPVKNCVVCATMSAGKSTFVNALLGMDVLPARHAATTAKVTSVYDKDGADGLIGFAQDAPGGFTDLCGQVDVGVLDGWNGDKDISRIFLQGDLDGIGNKGFKVVVHDTPGTNNSGDRKHSETTEKFLREVCPDVVIYVANAEQLCTTDEGELLKELFDNVVRPHKTPVIFALNKADSIDPEMESLEGLLKRYKAYLKGVGFVSPTICPVSSKAARLFKMALNGRANQFTERERKEFRGIVCEFTDLLSFDNESATRTTYGTVESFSIGDLQYKASLLRTALKRTGIQKIEVMLESLLSSNRTGETE